MLQDMLIDDTFLICLEVWDFLSSPRRISPLLHFWREMMIESSFRNGFSVCAEP